MLRVTVAQIAILETPEGFLRDSPEVAKEEKKKEKISWGHKQDEFRQRVKS